MQNKKLLPLYGMTLISFFILIRASTYGTRLQILLAAGGFAIFLALLVFAIRKGRNSHP